MEAEQDELVSYLKNQDAPCAKCLYDLHGLTSACCPECGYQNSLAEIEQMLVAREVNEYNWHQTIKWFQRCEILLSWSLFLNVWIAVFVPGGIYASHRIQIILVLVTLIIINEWFRYWVHTGYQKDTESFRRIVRKAEVYVYLLLAITLFPIVGIGMYLVYWISL